MASVEQQQAELKTLGNQALSNGKAEEALGFFTQAIDLGGSDSSARAILYSNRAACQMKLGDFTQALADAETCIRLDSDFPKGWSRKASALFSLGKLKDAQQCFEAAATKAKSESDAKSYREWAQKCAERMPANNQAPPRSAAASASAASVLPLPAVAARMLSLLAALYWAVTSDPQAYALSMYVLLATVAALVFVQCGRPRLSQQYLESVVRCDTKPSFYLVLTFASMVPNLPAVICVQAYDLVSLVRSVNALISTVSSVPQVAQVQSVVFDSPQLERLVGEGPAAWQGMNLQERFRRVDAKLDVLATRFELGVLLVLLFQLFTPAASPVSCILYSQVLKLRYLSHEQTRLQIELFDRYADAMAQRQPLVHKVYSAVRSGIVLVMKPRQ